MTGDFGRLGIGVPLFHCDPLWVRWWTWLLVGGFRPSDYLLMNSEIPHSVPIPLAHNAIVREFLKMPELDTLLIIEDDHTGDQDVVERMRTKPENQDFDIVCASYPNRRGGGPPILIGMDFVRQEANGEVGLHSRPIDIPRTGTQEVDCAALGCVLIRRWVLEMMEPDWFRWLGRNSQDVQFYWAARQLGARVGVDRDNHIGHVGRHIYTAPEFYAFWDDVKKEGIGDG
jgi:hypothetical protein